MAKRPENFVTRELEARRIQLGALEPYSYDPFPDLTLEQLEWLQRRFPPRCYNHRAENIEDHLKYAGKVELVELLASQWEDLKGGAQGESVQSQL